MGGQKGSLCLGELKQAQEETTQRGRGNSVSKDPELSLNAASLHLQPSPADIPIMPSIGGQRKGKLSKTRNFLQNAARVGPRSSPSSLILENSVGLCA